MSCGSMTAAHRLLSLIELLLSVDLKCCCSPRESFRELVLDRSGKLRWNRLENLVEESTKTLDYDPQQLWLMANWMLGDQGADIRQPVADELARLIDTAVAGRLTSS